MISKYFSFPVLPSTGCVLAVIFLSGCSSDRLPTYPVHGKVVFPDGSTVHIGSIEFKSLEHAIQARASIAPDGTFHLSTYEKNDGAVAGKHRCVITQMVMVEDIPNFKPSLEGIVDRRFASYATSGLEFNIQPSQDNSITVPVDGPHSRKSGEATTVKEKQQHKHDGKHVH